MDYLRRFAYSHIKDSVYAASDGTVTTFAVVAGVVGASLDPLAILILGFANLFADGFSMAMGNFLGSRSEVQLYHKERVLQEKSMTERPAEEREVIKSILAARRYEREELEHLTDLIMKNREFAVDLVMDEKIGITKPESGQETKSAIVTLISFISAGLIPLLPFIFFEDIKLSFLIAIAFTALTLFVVGALRVIFTSRNAFKAGLEMLFVGGIAAVIAYFVGFFLRSMIGSF